MSKRILVSIVALVLIVAACGDDDAGQSAPGGDLTDTEKALAAVIVEGMVDDTEGDSEDPFSDPVAATCFAEGLVADLGIARLAEVGLTSDSESPEAAFALLSEQEVNDMADLAFSCIDIETAMAQQFETDGISNDSARCMARELGETDFFRLAFIAGMTGNEAYDPSDDPEFLTVMLTVATECLTDEELAVIMGG